MIRGSAGFTLLEVLVVLVILGLAGAGAAAALPGWRSGQDLRRAGDGVSRLLADARRDAVTGRQLVVIRLDATGRLVRQDTGRSYTPPAGITLGLSGIAERDGHGPQGEAGDILVFLGDGSSTGGEVMIEAGTAREVRRVHWLTGRIDVAR